MKQLLGLFIFLTSLAFSCQPDTTVRKNNNSVIVKTKEFPILVDTFNFKTSIKIQEKFGRANYLPLYFGKMKDTIFVNYALADYQTPPPPPIPVSGDGIIEPQPIKPKPHIDFDLIAANRLKYANYFRIGKGNKYLSWDSASLNIVVDTSRIIKNINFTGLCDSLFAFEAYPVFLENKSGRKVAIGYGSHIDIILQAKNEQGQWQDIEWPYMYGCGTGLATIVIAEDEMALTSVPLFRGDFKTELRLRIGHNYSKPFRGTIDKRQLER